MPGGAVRIAIGALLALSPVLTALGLLALAEWRDRRRAAAIAWQVRLTDAISTELGGVVAPVVSKPLGGPLAGRHARAGRPAGAGEPHPRHHPRDTARAFGSRGTSSSSRRSRLQRGGANRPIRRSRRSARGTTPVVAADDGARDLRRRADAGASRARPGARRAPAEEHPRDEVIPVGEEHRDHQGVRRRISKAGGWIGTGLGVTRRPRRRARRAGAPRRAGADIARGTAPPAAGRPRSTPPNEPDSCRSRRRLRRCARRGRRWLDR